MDGAADRFGPDAGHRAPPLARWQARQRVAVRLDPCVGGPVSACCDSSLRITHGSRVWVRPEAIQPLVQRADQTRVAARLPSSKTRRLGEYADGSRPSVVFPSGTRCARHSSFTDRTNRSAYALQFGAAGGVRTTRTPAAASHRSTPLLYFGSRSHRRIRPSCSRPASPVACRRHWATTLHSGYGVHPMTWTRRDWTSSRNATVVRERHAPPRLPVTSCPR